MTTVINKNIGNKIKMPRLERFSADFRLKDSYAIQRESKNNKDAIMFKTLKTFLVLLSITLLYNIRVLFQNK